MDSKRKVARTLTKSMFLVGKNRHRTTHERMIESLREFSGSFERI